MAAATVEKTEEAGSDFMSPKEFARLTGVSPSQVSVMLAEGRLPVRAVRIGRLWRISRRDYEAWRLGEDR